MSATVTRTPAACLETPVPAPQTPGAPAAARVPDRPERLMSLDAYRGFIMLAMVSALGAGFAQVAKSREGDVLWGVLHYQFDHVAWEGCSFWDLIQPSFMFMVGVAMPFSYASRLARGRTRWQNFGHVVFRSLVLILLGVFLSSNGSQHTVFGLVNVLTQIGLGYTFVYLLLNRGVIVQIAAIVVILAGYWLFFFLHPLPGPDFDYASVGVTKEAERLPGWRAHWNKNTNAAAAFDVWFLNLFPAAVISRSDSVGVLAAVPGASFTANLPWAALAQTSQDDVPALRFAFRYNEGGYQTLNFIPSMATMIFGLMAGELLRGSRSSRVKLRYLLLGGAICLVLGVVFSIAVCPNVKRIWTPTWAVFSAGLTFYMLAGFYWVIDIAGYRRWAFPFVVVGMNSIAMYCMAQLMKGWVRGTLRTHLGQEIFGGIYGALWSAIAVLFVLWLICLCLYRRRIFIRI